MKFITSRTKKSKTILFVIAGVILLGAVAYSIYFFEFKRKKDYVFVQVRANQLKSGWGYEILTDGKIFIRQNFIPAVQGRHSFQTKEQALLVANKVLDKIKHKQSPTITVDELKQMHIIITDSLPAK